ncbi:MAG: hypothetical protein ACK4QW_06625 [Alphaproteobacteria bacterium]
MSATIIRMQDVTARREKCEADRRATLAQARDRLVDNGIAMLVEAGRLSQNHNLGPAPTAVRMREQMREDAEARAARRNYLREFVGREVTETEAEFAALIAARLQCGGRPPSWAYSLGPSLFDGVHGWLKHENRRKAVYKAAVTRKRKKREAARAAKAGTAPAG